MASDFLYHRVYSALRERIASGSLSGDGKLPGEKELIASFGVSAITVKKAMNMLVDEGLVVRIPGRGTFAREVSANHTKGHSPLVGVILEHVASPFGLEMMYEMDRHIEAEKRRMIVRFSYCDRERETAEIAFLQQFGVQGLIIMPSHGPNYNPEILRLVLSGFPVILIDKKLEGIDVPSVRTDNFSATCEMVHHLARRGCRHIGLISTVESGAMSTRERRNGFYRGIQESGLSAAAECVLPFGAMESRDMFDDAAERIAQYLLINQADLDGVVCSEYGIVPKLMRAAKDIHLDIERRMQICCIDEDDLAPHGYAFAHMKQDELSIARRAVEMLMARIRGEFAPAQDVLVPAIFRPK